jgi:hypothetical protein
MRVNVEKQIVGSVGVGGDGGVTAVESIESAWGKFISKLVLPNDTDTDDRDLLEVFSIISIERTYLRIRNCRLLRLDFWDVADLGIWDIHSFGIVSFRMDKF